MKNHVLIVDDDEMIQSMVAYLAKEGLDVRTTQVGSGKEMHQALKGDDIDLLVLDLHLPDENGLALARQIRSRSNIPIIVLTGEQSRDSLIAALEIGVNDFVVKPFDPYELQLRIKNQLQYNSQKRSPAHRKNKSNLAVGDMILDRNSMSLKTKNEKHVALTYNEFNILWALAQAPSRALSRNALLDAIGTGDECPSDRAIDVYISQIRKKIDNKSKRESLIKSVRGHGYMLVK